MQNADAIPILIDNLNFAYPGAPAALQNISLQVDEQDFVGIIGPNGGGKSTLLKLILGILHPNSGSIRVFGGAPDKSRLKVGYVPQHSTFIQQFPISVCDTVALGLIGISSTFGSISRNDRLIAAAMLEKVGVLKLAPNPIAELSGGQLQRVLIARALVAKPKLLLLDEPTASIDPHGEEDIFKILIQLIEKLTIVVVSHDVGFVSAYVSKIACISRNIVIHKPSEISPETLSKLYGGHVHAVVHNDHGQNK